MEALHRAAEEFRKLDIDVLGISGGDGTSGVTIGGFLHVYGSQALPRIALLRGGTGNTIADSLGVQRGRPDSLLARLLNAYLSSRPLRDVPRYVMHVRGDNPRRLDRLPTGEVSHGFSFGTGVVCGYLREYYSGGAPDALVAAKTLLRAIGSSVVRGPMIRRVAQPYRGSVQLADGSEWPARGYLAVAAGTIEQIGLGFTPFYRMRERPEAFQVLGIYAPPMGFVKQLDRIWRGRAMRPGHTYDVLTKGVRLESPDRPLTYMVDGDLYQCDGSIDVSLGPAVRIVLV